MKSARHRTLDVRPLFQQGVEPFPAIRNTIDSLGEHEGLILITPFLPSPLIDLLKNEGFSARPIRRDDGTWETHFSRD